jgi:hypothetical protein
MTQLELGMLMAAIFGAVAMWMWQRIRGNEIRRKELKENKQKYEAGWTDGYEVGRSEARKRVQKVKITPTKEK